ncbi:hypothetical protein GV791_15025 [Nocardia cyriacigeorgica]|uniref:Uncharacterized protein n=1 Tax=Nocardia cyriacigeorgica TaxID=135487 RepID=A0A6P1CRH8_9NOCA|nr:hypothetical protein [Nocardia cyriacigeorgica]NEW33866.1 hypothetical protein [Nocardia cyriacigeorgica]
MSGGSYDYLYRAEPDDLMRRGSDLAAMRERLTELGLKDVAAEVRKVEAQIQAYRDAVTERMERIGDVLQAVEWFDSNDWSEDQVREAVDRYRARIG